MNNIEMEILTNLSSTEKVHNSILFEPIEKQIFNFLKLYLEEQVYYKIAYETKKFFCDKYEIQLQDKRSNLTLDFIYKDINEWRIFQIHEVLHYNKDVFDKLKFFCDKINKVTKFCEEYSKLTQEFNSIASKEKLELILNNLNQKIKIDDFICYNYGFGYLHNFSIPQFIFFIKPIDGAPADGLLFVLNEDGKISLRDENEKLENLFRRKKYSSDINGMKQKVKDYEIINDIINSQQFEILPELHEVFEIIKNAIQLKNKIDNICNKNFSKNSKI